MGIVSNSKSRSVGDMFDNVDEKEKEIDSIVNGGDPDVGYSVKIVALGGHNSGIGSILDIYRGNRFDEDEEFEYTGVDFFTKEIWCEDKIIKATIWDYRTSSHQSLIGSIFKGTKGLVVGFDPTEESTFDVIPSLVKSCTRLISNDDLESEKCLVMIVAKTSNEIISPKEEEEENNQSVEKNEKVKSKKRIVSMDSGIEFAKNNQFLYCEVNVDHPNNIDHPFNELTKCIFEKHMSEGIRDEMMNPDRTRSLGNKTRINKKVI